MPLPSATDVTVTGGAPPFDYKAFGESQAKADFARASAGPGWQFDPEKIEPVINQLQDLVDYNLRKIQSETQTFAQIPSKVQDPASLGYESRADASISVYSRAIQGRVTAVSSYIDTLRQIRDAYKNQDHAALKALRTENKDS
jgi:hypothetical protein